MIQKIIGIILGLGVISMGLFWGIYLRDVPSIEKLAEWGFFRESTVIYDAKGNEIYSLFKDGKRTYINYDDISPTIIDAIISTEDRTFFENPGVDIKWLVRAGIKYIIGSNDGIKGTSTISQQLIKNTLLSNERSLKRKIQEAYLSYRLNDAYTKEDILEMYLNAISFWYNANGIEQASRTFFGKSAKDVGPLGATILASLPKWPTFYSPYLHRDRLMGKVEIYTADDSSNKILINEKNAEEFRELYEKFKTYASGITLEHDDGTIRACNFEEKHMKNKSYSPGRDGCTEFWVSKILDFLGNIAYTDTSSKDNESYTLEYTIGRKDFVASQMLEDKKIDGGTFKKIFYDGLDFQFKKYSENIKYPYFVMYVKEYLETKYGKDIDITSGLKVYTTINPELQDKAEELVKKQADINKKQFWANSAALVSMDNIDGKLLAMVWGPDYFDIENGGNNNMAVALRQPGSSFKPLIYALAISKNPIWWESPIADVATKFGKWEPNNYDLKFNGVMTVKNALAYSRNIPAAKMFFLAWGEEEIVKFWKSIGLASLRENAWYGWPLAIGAAEIRPIELMQAYSVLANNGVRNSIYFISKIEDSDGNILEEQKITTEAKEPIFSPAASYIVSKILSDNNARPESTFWRNALTVNGRTLAAKTGTANKPAAKGTKTILPGDLWTAGYSPQITTVVWAGNVNGKATRGSCDGLNCAAPIWKWFMEFAHKNLPKEEFKKPKDLYTYDIVKTSGKLATKDTPKDQVVTTIMAVKLNDYDGGLRSMEIDTLCNGPVSENTPEAFRKTVYIPAEKPIIDGYDPAWTSGFFEAIKWWAPKEWEESPTYSDEPCERPGGPGNILITIDSVGINATSGNKKTIEIWWIGDREVYSLILKKDGKEERVIQYGTGGQKNGKERIAVVFTPGGNEMSVQLVDRFGFTYTESKTLLENGTESSWWENSTTSNSNWVPTINMINPKSGSISIYEGTTFNLRFWVTIGTANREIQVLVDNISIQNATSGDMFVIPVGSAGLEAGKHTLKIIATDGNFQKAEKVITLNILKR